MHETVFGSLLQRIVYYACSLYGSPDAPRPPFSDFSPTCGHQGHYIGHDFSDFTSRCSAAIPRGRDA